MDDRSELDQDLHWCRAYDNRNLDFEVKDYFSDRAFSIAKVLYCCYEIIECTKSLSIVHEQYWLLVCRLVMVLSSCPIKLYVWWTEPSILLWLLPLIDNQNWKNNLKQYKPHQKSSNWRKNQIEKLK